MLEYNFSIVNIIIVIYLNYIEIVELLISEVQENSVLWNKWDKNLFEFLRATQ